MVVWTKRKCIELQLRIWFEQILVPFSHHCYWMTCWPGAEDHCIQSLHVFHPARPHNPGHCIILTSILLHTILNSPAYYTQLVLQTVFHPSSILHKLLVKYCILHTHSVYCTACILHTITHTTWLLCTHCITTHPSAYMGLKPCSGSQILMQNWEYDEYFEF